LNQLQGPNLTWDPLLLDGSYQVNDASSQTNSDKGKRVHKNVYQILM
jgi:hypothetical protein